jgi:hypothetical protein
MAYQTCPNCRLSLRTRFPSLPVQYCPRCLARRRRLVEFRDTTDRLPSSGDIDQSPGVSTHSLAEEHGQR